MYNLRQTALYRRQRVAISKTRPVTVNIGERRKPKPQGQPGYLRIDSVHQGDLDGIKGLYLINAIDEVTQFQFIAAVERISEQFLLPILERLIRAFPFTIRGFHADNGSEYINHRVAKLLNKLQATEFTKSRARRSNGRVEMWRGGLRLGLSVAASFVWRCLISLAITPFPHPARQTGRAVFPHPAFFRPSGLRIQQVSTL